MRGATYQVAPLDPVRAPRRDVPLVPVPRVAEIMRECFRLRFQQEAGRGRVGPRLEEDGAPRDHGADARHQLDCESGAAERALRPLRALRVLLYLEGRESVRRACWRAGRLDRRVHVYQVAQRVVEGRAGCRLEREHGRRVDLDPAAVQDLGYASEEDADAG